MKFLDQMTINKFFISVILTLTSFSALTLKDDTHQPIRIISDNQSLDMGKNIVTFSKNVTITQGSILIKANKVIITRPIESANKRETIEAFGNPVSFYQTLDNGKPVNARANKVHYDLSSELLTLVGNAELKQLDSKINGETISYDVKRQQLKARGSHRSRVKTVLIPNR